MKRKVQSTTTLKAAQNDIKFSKIVKFPHEIVKAKMQKLKLGVINPESTFQEPFQVVEGLSIQPQSTRLSLNSSSKKHSFKPFPQRHLQSVFEYSQTEFEQIKDLDSETIMAKETAWIKSPKQLGNIQDYNYFFKNMPPANYFTTENQRKIICQVFDYLEDIMDNQRFSVRLKRILKEKEYQVEAQKKFKRFKRRKQREVIDKIKIFIFTPIQAIQNIKSSSGNENDLTLMKNYKIADLWEILKENLFKIKKMSQQSLDIEELTCEEFVQFLNDLGFENQNTLRLFFEEMKTMRVGRQSSRNSQDQNSFVLKIRLFMNNFQKYVDNNEKIIYLHSQNAVYMRNRSFKQIKQKLKQKRKQEQNCLQFLKEVKENDEDEIVFELEDILEERQKQLNKPKSSYKEVEVHNEAVKMIQEELEKAHEQINQVYGKSLFEKFNKVQIYLFIYFYTSLDAIADKTLDFIEQRNKFYIQKKLFCNMLHDIDVFPGVDEFIAFIDEKIFEVKSNQDTITTFCQNFIDDKDTFNEFNVNLIEIADYMFRQNYGEEQTRILSKFVDQLKYRFREQKNLNQNVDIKGVQLINMNVFEIAQQDVNQKYQIKIDFLEGMKERVNQLLDKYLNKISINQKKNAEMNFLYEYLLKCFNTIDSKMEQYDKGLNHIVRYLEDEEVKNTNDYLGQNEEDIDARFHNLLESMIFEIYKLIGEDVPNHIIFMIDTRTYKQQKFLELLATKQTSISFSTQFEKEDDDHEFFSNKQQKKQKVKVLEQDKGYQSIVDKETNKNQYIHENQSSNLNKEQLEEDYDKNNDNNDEDDFLLGIFGKQKPKFPANFSDLQNDNQKKAMNDQTTVKKLPGSNQIQLGQGLKKSNEKMQLQTIQKQTQFNQEEERKSYLSENNNPSTLSNHQFKYSKYSEEEQEAEQVLKSIKNSSILKKSGSSTQQNRMTNRFEQYKIKMPPEYFGMHQMKTDQEFRAFQDTKNIKFSPDIDKKVLQFQMEVELDEAKKQNIFNFSIFEHQFLQKGK